MAGIFPGGLVATGTEIVVKPKPPHPGGSGILFHVKKAEETTRVFFWDDMRAGEFLRFLKSQPVTFEWDFSQAPEYAKYPRAELDRAEQLIQAFWEAGY